ncbi:hypothetical protein [Streptomyces xanthii]|uniref:DUF3592 domain-containing protein n=1 Tax=Streptomyces xanthii TaxID=2768069 RepID=A0A7H1B3Q3_9ACTN|nr:hypothetical protein [Streptomyces xanthii]QNS03358.1 hypothetical protein IAG42_06735 [Streptomyces xanthii]
MAASQRGSGRARPAREPCLADRMRAALWGPAEFVGPPGPGLLAHGLAVGAAGTGAVTAAGAVGMWAGPPVLARGEAGLMVVAALVVYLAVLRAGRALVGIVAVLGVCLTLTVPQAAAGLALAERGRVEQAKVASVERVPGHRRSFCELVPESPHAPPGTRIWRGCTAATGPGDDLTIVYDPRGRAPLRGSAQPHERRATALRLAALALGVALMSALAVVRSFRLTASTAQAETHRKTHRKTQGQPEGRTPGEWQRGTQGGTQGDTDDRKRHDREG